MTAGAGLRRFVTADSGPANAAGRAAAGGSRPGPAAATDPGPAAVPEVCDFCATAIPSGHGHVADLERSGLMCACRACYLLFTRAQEGGARYQSVPDRYLTDPARELTVSEWDTLQIPVGLAFFLRSSATGTVTAFYPSPAGATECQLDLHAWALLAADHPLLGTAADDVEAVLVTRSGDGVESFLVPVDACYELAGRMRQHWRGFDGGEEARQAIADFLGGARDRARALAERS